MAARVLFAQKHGNMLRIILVRGRRMRNYRIDWPVRCNHRLVVSDFLDEATTCHCRK